MDLIPLKLLLTPLIVLGLGAVARRWGPGLGGLVTGLPLTSGPVFAFVAIEQGPEFAAAAAVGILIGIASVGIFCLTYASVARHLRWPAGVIAGAGGFIGCTALFQATSPGLGPAALITVGVLGAVLFVFPRPSQAGPTRSRPAWDLPGRALTSTALVFVLTAAAPRLGPQLGGLLTPFPAFAIVLAAFTQAHDGAAAATVFLRGVVLASFANAAFFILAALALLPWGLGPTLATAAACAAVVAWLVHRLDCARSSHLEPIESRAGPR
jgi:hypothetical protein